MEQTEVEDTGTRLETSRQRPEGEGEAGEDLERLLELLCFLSSLVQDDECRIHFTEILVRINEPVEVGTGLLMPYL